MFHVVSTAYENCAMLASLKAIRAGFCGQSSVTIASGLRSKLRAAEESMPTRAWAFPRAIREPSRGLTSAGFGHEQDHIRQIRYTNTKPSLLRCLRTPGRFQRGSHPGGRDLVSSERLIDIQHWILRPDSIASNHNVAMIISTTRCEQLVASVLR